MNESIATSCRTTNSTNPYVLQSISITQGDLSVHLVHRATPLPLEYNLQVAKTQVDAICTCLWSNQVKKYAEDKRTEERTNKRNNQLIMPMQSQVQKF